MNSEYSIGVFKFPVGNLLIEATKAGISRIEFTSRKPASSTNKIILDAKKQLEEYFSVGRKKFDLKLDVQGTHFQKKVWKALQKVSFGKMVTYGELASLAGSPAAARAVGSVMNKNPVCIVVPCHRVFSKANPYLYGAGPEKKKMLLKHESLEHF